MTNVQRSFPEYIHGAMASRGIHHPFSPRQQNNKPIMPKPKACKPQNKGSCKKQKNKKQKPQTTNQQHPNERIHTLMGFLLFLFLFYFCIIISIAPLRASMSWLSCMQPRFFQIWGYPCSRKLQPKATGGSATAKHAAAAVNEYPIFISICFEVL